MKQKAFGSHFEWKEFFLQLKLIEIMRKKVESALE